MMKKKTAYSLLYKLITILATVAVVMFTYMGAMAAYDFGYRIFAESSMSLEPGRDVEFAVKEGMNVGKVAEALEEQGIIRDAMIFKVQNRLSHYKNGFRAGVYNLNTSMTNDEIMAILSGEVSQETE